MKIYIIGSFKNGKIEPLAEKLRALRHIVFDDWRGTHPESDQVLWKYEKNRGHNYKQALRNLAARNNFEFDMRHLAEADVAILVMDAGRSAHLEAGYMRGRGKPVFVLMDTMLPERFDLMHNMLTDFFESEDELITALAQLHLSSPLNESQCHHQRSLPTPGTAPIQIAPDQCDANDLPPAKDSPAPNPIRRIPRLFPQ